MTGRRRPLPELIREVGDGTSSLEQALLALDRRLVAQAASSFALDPAGEGVLRGVSAGPGAASGVAAFDGGAVLALALVGVPSILVAYETFPEDIEAMKLSRGVVTVSGGLTGHAGVVSRGLGKPCIASGGNALQLRGEVLVALTSPPRNWGFGDRFSFDGKTGIIVEGAAELAALGHDLDEALAWADTISGARLLAKVTCRVDAENAKRMGAHAIVVDGSDALFLGHERRLLVDAVVRGDAEAEARLVKVLVADLEAIRAGFGCAPESIFALGHPSNLSEAIGVVLHEACETLSMHVTERVERPAFFAEEIPGARLAAALDALASGH